MSRRCPGAAQRPGSYSWGVLLESVSPAVRNRANSSCGFALNTRAKGRWSLGKGGPSGLTFPWPFLPGGFPPERIIALGISTAPCEGAALRGGTTALRNR